VEILKEKKVLEQDITVHQQNQELQNI